jgi:hypothetical protein
VRILEFEKLVAVLARVTRAFFVLFVYIMTGRGRRAKGGTHEKCSGSVSRESQIIGREICVLVSVELNGHQNRNTRWNVE